MAKIFIANWKMNLTYEASIKLAREYGKYLKNFSGQVIVCPDFLSLPAIASILKGGRLSLGAQDCAPAKLGAYTGAVSPANLKKLGVKYVIIGHSERRGYFKEDNVLINQKLKEAQAVGLQVILCVGESAQERCEGKTLEIVKYQVKRALKGLSKPLIIAYEPVWAIGSGRNATAIEASEVHSLIKSEARQILKKEIKVIYGGSLNAKNGPEFKGAKDVDGFLVGGASLKASEFYKICQL
ncbi:MAG: triose-phosphate isomerase [Patescibacteria group bacterium]